MVLKIVAKYGLRLNAQKELRNENNIYNGFVYIAFFALKPFENLFEFHIAYAVVNEYLKQHTHGNLPFISLKKYTALTLQTQFTERQHQFSCDAKVAY